CTKKVSGAMVSTNLLPYFALSCLSAPMRLATTGVVGAATLLSPAFNCSELPSKSTSRPSRPQRSMMAETEFTKVVTDAADVSCTWPLAPPMEISTFLPLACLALMAARKSASDSTVGHSLTEQRVKFTWPEVGEVGSAKA